MDIKLPMHPHADGGAASSESFKHFSVYKNKEITANFVEETQKNLKTENQDYLSKTHLVLIFKSAENSAFLSMFVFLGFFRSTTNQFKINNYCIADKYEITGESLFNQSFLYDNVYCFLFSRYKFSDSIEGRAVESCPGVAGTKGHRVSTLARAGHGIRSAQVYAALSPRATYNSTVNCKENVSCKLLSDVYYLNIRKELLFVGIVSIVYCDGYLDTNFVYFRTNYFCVITEPLSTKDRIVHRWVSTGFFSLWR